MNELTEQNYNSMADDNECTDELTTGNTGCMLFLSIVSLAFVFLISLIIKAATK